MTALAKPVAHLPGPITDIEQVTSATRRIGRILKSKVPGRRRITFVVNPCGWYVVSTTVGGNAVVAGADDPGVCYADHEWCDDGTADSVRQELTPLAASNLVSLRKAEDRYHLPFNRSRSRRAIQSLIDGATPVDRAAAVSELSRNLRRGDVSCSNDRMAAPRERR